MQFVSINLNRVFSNRQSRRHAARAVQATSGYMICSSTVANDDCATLDARTSRKKHEANLYVRVVGSACYDQLP